MVETQKARVESLAAERVRSLCGFTQVRGHAPLPAIDRVSQKPMAHMGHVHADLVGAPGFEPALNKGRVAPERLQDPNSRHRASPRAENHRLTLTVGAMSLKSRCQTDHGSRLESHAPKAPKPRIARIRDPVANRGICPLNRVRLELRREPMVRRVGLCHHQQTGGVLVDPVHNSGPPFASHPRKITAKMAQKRIDQSTARASRSGVHHETRGLVDHHEMIVLVNDTQGDVLGDQMCFGGHIHPDLESFALAHARLGIQDRRATAKHRALDDEPRQARP